MAAYLDRGGRGVAPVLYGDGQRRAICGAHVASARGGRGGGGRVVVAGAPRARAHRANAEATREMTPAAAADRARRAADTG